MPRLSVNMNDETAAVLRGYADEHGLTVTEAVRKWASLIDLLERERKDGGVVLLRKGGVTREVILL